MAIRWEETEGELRFFITGEIDHHNSIFLRREMEETIRKSRAPSIVLDLSGTEFCDSSALGLILGRARQAQALSRTLIVQNPSARARKILDLCGAERFLKYS